VKYVFKEHSANQQIIRHVLTRQYVLEKAVCFTTFGLYGQLSDVFFIYFILYRLLKTNFNTFNIRVL